MPFLPSAPSAGSGYTRIFRQRTPYDDFPRPTWRSGVHGGVMSIQPAALLAELSATRAVSGSELAQSLGVTRAAVWKQIEALRALGAPIHAAAGRGYRLSWPLELLDAARIRAELEAPLRKRLGDLSVLWQTPSTSDTMLRSVGEGARDLSVCVAETQSAGRGRRGRGWQSPLGGNVYFSLLKRFPQGMGALSGLSLVAGLALIQALIDCGVSAIGLKWPNDVLADGRKLAGILVELGGEFLGPCHAVIGIGVNLRLPQNVSIDQPAVDLAQLCAGMPPSRNRLIGRLLARLITALDRFNSEGFAGFRSDYARHDLLAGCALRVKTADATRDGIAEGIDARGALRVRHGAEVVSYDSAEVSVRRA
jgi:BirA family transcriptional regulator, biotin operon repressor / biotin---[acetyl-CoA-carboxylase] ligase